MKQSATRRNKKRSDSKEVQLARLRQERSGFLRPVGMPADIKTPRTRQIYEYINEYVKTGNVKESALAVGFSEKWATKNVYDVMKTYSDYIHYMKELVAHERAKILALDSQSVLDEIARIGMANEFDYIVVEERNGKKTARRKHLHEMSREEMTAIKVVRLPNGDLAYDLHDKTPALMALGKNLGLFNEKLIIERRNVNLKAKIDLSKVPTEDLLKIIQSFEQTIETSGNGRLLEAQ